MEHYRDLNYSVYSWVRSNEIREEQKQLQNEDDSDEDDSEAEDEDDSETEDEDDSETEDEDDSEAEDEDDSETEDEDDSETEDEDDSEADSELEYPSPSYDRDILSKREAAYKAKLNEEKNNSKLEHPKTKGKSMSRLEKQAKKTQDGALVAAKLTLGKVTIKKLMAEIEKLLPKQYRGLSKHPIANLFVPHFFDLVMAYSGHENNKKVVAISEAAHMASAMIVSEHFDIEGILNGFLDKVNVPENLLGGAIEE